MSDIPKWVTYSLVNSLLCICGGLCVPLISKIFKTRKNINTKLVNYGLSLSAGSMITTSLYKMLPHMDGSNNYHVFFGLLFGILTSLSINYVVHAFASESLVHCAHSDNPEESSNLDHDHSHDHNNFTDTSDASRNASSTSILSNSEATPLLPKKNTTKSSLNDIIANRGPISSTERDIGSCVPMAKSKSFSFAPELIQATAILRSSSLQSVNPNTSISGQKNKCCGNGMSCLENDVGYDLENISMYRDHFLSGRKSLHDLEESGHIHDTHGTMTSSATINSLIEHEHHDKDHHHHLETPFSKLLSIGLQTCVVLTIHKFPEGFIIYYTNRSDQSSSLGFSIFVSLAIHNFVEGFSMTLPFYAVFESKIVPILITTLLGGGSQPLGALLGYWFFKGKVPDSNPTKGELKMDSFLSLTAGFLLVIGLQMFQTGIGFSDGHHHHNNEEGGEVKENHSLGTTCLKWSCFGVLLILASGLFVK